MTLDELEKSLRAARVYRLVVLPLEESRLRLVASTFSDHEPVEVTGRGLDDAAGRLLAELQLDPCTLQCRACVAASFGDVLTSEGLARARALGALCDEHDGVVREVEE